MASNDYDFLQNKIGSPLEYSDNLYLVYIEVFKTTDEIHKIISKHGKIVQEIEFGYLCELHMQAIPEITRSMSLENHAIYQIVRLVRLNKNTQNS
jgi:hypothetical protein